MIASSEFSKSGQGSLLDIMAQLLSLAKGDERDWLNNSLESYIPTRLRHWLHNAPNQDHLRLKNDNQRQWQLSDAAKLTTERNLRRLRKGRQVIDRLTHDLVKEEVNHKSETITSPFDQLKFERGDVFLSRKTSQL